MTPPIPLDNLRANNAKTTPTNAHEMIMCPVFRLGFIDYRQKRFAEDWEWMDIIRALGLQPKVLGTGKWSYERGQSFAQCCPEVSAEEVGAVTKDNYKPVIRKLDQAFARGDVM